MVVSNSIEAKWIGEPISVDRNQPTHPNHIARLYSKCIFGALTLQVGDFVLVSNVDAAEPDTVEGCDVARIVHLYELYEVLEKDPYRAIVQWYSRPHCIPHKEFDNDNVLIDFDIEVIEDHRPYDADISLETIFQKCHVVTGSSNDCASTLLEPLRSGGGHRQRYTGPIFVCRYKFIQLTTKKFQLQPLEYKQKQSPEIKRRIRNRSERLTLSASKSEEPERRILPKRRASVYVSSNLTEFVDMNDLQSKVSPIKIVGGCSVVRLSMSAKKARSNTNATPASPLAERNARVTPTHRAAARRNLNLSLDKEANSTAESDCLNYSIIGSTVAADRSTNEVPGEIKIKLRISERRRSVRLASIEDPLCLEKEKKDEYNDDVEVIAKQLQRKRLGAISSTPNSDPYRTPSKKAKDATSTTIEVTPSTRRKSILKSATRRLDDGTPRRSIQLSNIVEQRIFQEDAIISTPKRGRKSKVSQQMNSDEESSYTPKKLATKTDSNCTPKKATAKTATPSRSASKKAAMSPETPSTKMRRIRTGELPANFEQRVSTPNKTPKTDLQLAREQLHVSVVPNSLPCREKEFQNIYNFLECKIRDKCGGCMYISGVPGTGKTATVTSVIRTLQAKSSNEELPEFEFLEINGMRLTEPRQAYVQIYKQLTGKSVSWEHAHSLLEKRFTTPAPRRVTTVLLVDELDILCNRRQDVVYNLLDWPTKSAARLVVVTIANTMDLPERLLMGKVTSRLGLTRLTFQPYTFKQLETIVVARLSGSGAFKGEAVQLVARKVAAVSGDARRALDICRRATEVADAAHSKNAAAAQKCVTIVHVQQALAEMIASAKVQAIKNCSRLEQMFLQAIVAEVTRTGVEETNFMGVYTQLESIVAIEGVKVPAPGRCLRICSKLSSERLLIGEHSRNDLFQKILLNVSSDDIHYALQLHC